MILEPTRNAWVPLAAWLRAHCAKVVLVPPEQSADLRDYYNKHTKTDRLLDCECWPACRCCPPLWRGRGDIDDLGPGETLRRAVRHRSTWSSGAQPAVLRLDALVELLGPAWADVLGVGDYTKTALAVLGRYADPVALKKLGRKRLATLMIRSSRGAWREAKADEPARRRPRRPFQLWARLGGPTPPSLGEDIAVEVRVIAALDAEIATIEDRIEALYDEVDPAGIVRSAPGVGVTLAAGILGRTGDLRRFANLAGVRSLHRDRPRFLRSTSPVSPFPPRAPPRPATPGCAKPFSSPPTRPARSTRRSPPATTVSSSTEGKTTSPPSTRSPPPHDPHRRLLAQRSTLRTQRP